MHNLSDAFGKQLNMGDGVGDAVARVSIGRWPFSGKGVAALHLDNGIISLPDSPAFYRTQSPTSRGFKDNWADIDLMTPLPR